MKIDRALSLLLIHTRFDDVTRLCRWNKFRGLCVDWMGVRVPVLVLYPYRHICMHSTPPPCSAGQLCTLTAFNLSSYLRGERDYLPWAAALNWIHTLGVRLSLTPVYGKYKVLSISHGLLFSCGVTAIFSMLDLSH